MMPGRLFRWVFTGSLPWPLLLLYSALLLTVVHFGTAAPTWLEYIHGTQELADWNAWNARADAWSFAGLLLATGLCARAAWLVQRWRRQDIDWLRTRPVSAWRVLLAAWSGLCAAALGWLLVTALLIETHASASQCMQARGRIDAAQAMWIEGEAAQRVRLSGLPAGDVVSLAIVATRGAPEVRVEAGWMGSQLSTQAVISTRGRAELAIPDSREERVLELRVSPPSAAALWAPMDSHVLERVQAPLGPSLRMLVSCWLWICIGMGLCLLGALCMRAPIALALGAALVLLLGEGLESSPTLEYLRRGWLPSWPGASLLATALAVFVAAPALGSMVFARSRRQR